MPVLTTLRVAALAIGMAALPPIAAAQHSGESRQAGQHVHGALEIVIAVEGDSATIELQSAMWNLVGFEHAPTNQVEADEWIAARTRLQTPDKVARFPDAAGCSMVSTELGPFAGANSGSAGGDHDHHDHEDHQEEGEYHDAVLGWTFACKAPQAVRSVELQLFESFPRIESVDAVLFTDAGQASGTLSPGSTTLRIN